MMAIFKSLFLAFALFFVSSTISVAQKFSGSFFGGLSSSQVAGDQLSGFNKAGVIVGASVFLPVKSNLGVEMEIHFNAGFSIAQLLSSKEEDEGGEIPESQTLPFEKTEFAVCGGMYYGFNEKFFLDLRLSNSILPIRKIGEKKIGNIESGQYNSVLSFTLKYRIGFKQQN